MNIFYISKVNFINDFICDGISMSKGEFLYQMLISKSMERGLSGSIGFSRIKTFINPHSIDYNTALFLFSFRNIFLLNSACLPKLNNKPTSTLVALK